MQDGSTEVGRLHEHITLDCPLTGCLNYLGRTWSKFCCRPWKKTDLSLCQQHRTSNVLILLRQKMNLDDWSARCSKPAAKISATDLLLWILNSMVNVFFCQIRFYFSSKFFWRHNFRLLIASCIVFMMCAYVKLSILLNDCVSVCSNSFPGVWSVG